MGHRNLSSKKQTLHHLIGIGRIAVSNILDLVASGVDHDAAASLFYRDAIP